MRPIVALIALACGACGPALALDSAAEGSAAITRLTWFLIGLGGAVFAVVLVLLIAAARRRQHASLTVDLSPRSHAVVVVGGGVIPVLILALVLVVSVRATHHETAARDVPTFRIVGHQWWWDVEYVDSSVARRFHTANELHVPVGETVRILGESRDVIHSFWVPQLQGKTDLIPGSSNEFTILALRAGTYRGQCAEYCGLQHALMAFTVIAESPSQFRAWLAAQQQPAREPTPADSVVAVGRNLFTSALCATCHRVRGTSATGELGPDLTHVASRAALAAGTLPNTLAAMEAWITNAQSLKPGALMPSMPQFDGPSLHAVAAYLMSLR
jgi:cytochrome c oxidase subunit 2